MRPGGNLWNYSLGAWSLTLLTTTHFENTDDFTRTGGYQVSSPKNDHPFGNSKVILTGIGNGCCIFKMISRKELIQLRLTIITSLLRQNDVAKAFWRNDDFITASRVHSILHVMSGSLCCILGGQLSTHQLQFWLTRVSRGGPVHHGYHTGGPSGGVFYCRLVMTLQWRPNERDAVSNHRRLDCLLNRLFRCRSNMFPFDDVIMNSIRYFARMGRERTSIHCNDVSHWLGTSLESAQYYSARMGRQQTSTYLNKALHRII